MIFSSVQNPAPEIRALPAVAVDMGFSKANGRSTGFATTHEGYNGLPRRVDVNDGIWHSNLTFGEAIEQTSGVFRCLLPHVESVLIVEAPLSESFDCEGNPKSRGEFEDAMPWYRGAGALTALAGCYFLTKLLEEIGDLEGTIHLVEGFVTGHASGNHRCVAMDLVRKWQEGERLIEPQSLLLSFLALPPDCAVPWVLICEDQSPKRLPRQRTPSEA